MSYEIKVTVRDGQGTAQTQGLVPDGAYYLRGHIDERREDISASRNTVDNQLASMASSTHYKEV